MPFFFHRHLFPCLKHGRTNAALAQTAILEDIPIVPVQLNYVDRQKESEAGYDFTEQKEFMQQLSTALDPAAAAELLGTMTAEYPDHSLTLESLGRRLHYTVPKALSHRYTPDASARERRAQVENVLDAIAVAASADARSRMTFWRGARAFAKALPRLGRLHRVAPATAAPVGPVPRAAGRSSSAPMGDGSGTRYQLASDPVPLHAGGRGKLPPMVKSDARGTTP